MLKVPGIPQIFSRNRYQEIKQYLHFVYEVEARNKGDSRKELADFDPLFKVRNIISHLQKS